MGSHESGQTVAPQSASRARDHLANERTFLAWVRTSLALIGLGFVLARMGLFLQQFVTLSRPPVAHPRRAGHEFVVTGMVVLCFGTLLSGWSGWLYTRARRLIDADRYEPANHSVLVLTVCVVVGGLVILGLVLWRTTIVGL